MASSSSETGRTRKRGATSSSRASRGHGDGQEVEDTPLEEWLGMKSKPNKGKKPPTGKTVLIHNRYAEMPKAQFLLDTITYASGCGCTSECGGFGGLHDNMVDLIYSGKARYAEQAGTEVTKENTEVDVVGTEVGRRFSTKHPLIKRSGLTHAEVRTLNLVMDSVEQAMDKAVEPEEIKDEDFYS